MSKCTTYVIQVELIVCKADIMRDPVTEDTCGCPAHEPFSERGIMDYSHAKQEVEIGGGSALYIYNNWGMQWGIHAGSPRS